MYYKRMTNNELREYQYPNLIAEWRESRYSVNTLGDHMGLGAHRSENDPEIWAKLRGEMEMTIEEAENLAKLFGVKMGYLFSNELKTLEDKPIAYWRWLESNQKMDEDLRQYREREKIVVEMKEKPYLLKIFRIFSKMKEEDLEKIVDELERSVA